MVPMHDAHDTGYDLDDDPARIQPDVVWDWLSTEAYWGRWRSRADVETQLANSWRVVGDVVVPFEPVISDPESRELAWVPADLVSTYPLHPGFAASWAHLQTLVDVRPAVVVDVANVMGSVPDGWWRDRPGAASRLLGRIAELAAGGVEASALDLPEQVWYPQWSAVVEGQARSVGDVAGIDVVRAAGEGDDTVVAEARRLAASGHSVTVVTSDRGLSERVKDAGAAVRGTRWLLDQLSDR